MINVTLREESMKSVAVDAVDIDTDPKTDTLILRKDGKVRAMFSGGSWLYLMVE